MLDIFCCELRAVDAESFERYRELLSDDERARLASFRRESAARAFLASRALLRTALAERLGVAPQALRFVRDANDKPQLVGQPLHFNVSHSEAWVALAVSDVAAIGVDIETSARRNDILGVARRFFQPREFEWLNALPQAQRAEKFCELWTLKEACVKWSGLGIGRAIAGVGVDIADGAIALHLRRDIAPDMTPGAALFALTPQVRLAAVGEVSDWRLLQSEPLQGVRPLALAPLARG